ncbi:hypothetical protein HPHPH34_0576 [Helicobacter pylori Hp H-34]|uniref:Uncharacterized protein n=1 Tax=Helicobacter pylori Hp H-34 TaxID=992069 RepID=J0PE81_HELPX|nr:hypothetical protein HPHPH34_0576 [Helicobacter pylori Hp H-34]
MRFKTPSSNPKLNPPNPLRVRYEKLSLFASFFILVIKTPKGLF